MNQKHQTETASQDSSLSNESGSLSYSPPGFSLTASEGDTPPDMHGPAIQRQEGPQDPPPSSNKAIDDARKIYDICDSYFGDGSKVAGILSGQSVGQLGYLRTIYRSQYGIALEQHLEDTLKTTNYKAAMVHLWPALGLHDRLRLTKGFLDDNESAMKVIIKESKPAERLAARGNSKTRDFLLAELAGMDLYETHKLLYPPASFPVEHWNMALQVIREANNILWDDDDHLYMVIMDLNPTYRRKLWDEHQDLLSFASASREQLHKLCLGDEASMLNTSADLATSGLGTYDNMTEKLVNHTADKVNRQTELEEKAASGDESVNSELQQLGDVKGLVNPDFDGDGLEEDSFLRKLDGDLDEATFRGFASQLNMSHFDQAKRMILNAPGFFNDDEQAMKDAFAMILDQTLRDQLWNDPQVKAAIEGSANEAEQKSLLAYKDGDSYAIAEERFLDMANTINPSRDDVGDMIALFKTLNEADRTRLASTHADKLKLYKAFAGHQSDIVAALDAVIATGKVPTALALDAAGEGAGTTEELIYATLRELTDQERFMLRAGYAMSKGYTVPETVLAKGKQVAARAAFDLALSELDSELEFDELQRAMDIITREPSLIEYQVEGGLEMSAFILTNRISEKDATRDGGAGDNFIDLFSNTGGAADMSAIGALSHYQTSMKDGEMGGGELSELAAREGEFNEHYEEHVAAADSVAEIASTVAAVAAAVIVTIGTAGTGGPAAAAGLSAYLGGTSAATIVGAAAAGGLAKVATQEAIGGEHFDAGQEGGRSFALGAVDGMLTAVSAGLAKTLQASFYSAVGLRGGQLTAELSAGAVRSMDFSLKTLGKQALDGAVRGAIDGGLSGAIGEVVFTAADEANWRKGIWDTLSTFGMALMRGAAMGAAGGAVAGGMMEGAAFTGKKLRGGVDELDEMTGTSKAKSEEPEGPQSRQLDGDEVEETNVLRTGAEPGLDPSPETIKVGTVRMEEHPQYSKTISKIEEYGYKIRFIPGEASVETIEVLDKTGAVLGIEKYVNIFQGMRFLDLEHEFGHVLQNELRLKGVITSTKRVRRFEDNRPDKLLPAGPTTMKNWQYPIIEYHNRLDEFIRLAGRTDDLSILGPHADGVIEWKNKMNKILRGGKPSKVNKFKDDYFADIINLEGDVRKLMVEKGLR